MLGVILMHDDVLKSSAELAKRFGAEDFKLRQGGNGC